MITEQQAMTLLIEANPVPDMSTLDLNGDPPTTRLTEHQLRSRDMAKMQTDRRIKVEQGAEEPRRGPIIGIVAAAVVIVIGASVVFQTTDTPPVAGEPATAVETAAAFVEAFGTLDAVEALSYLSADVVNSEFGGLDGFHLDWQWRRAQGFKIMLDTCEELSTSSSGTSVQCTYDYHAIRSDELGLGPYSGSRFFFTVQDGKIVGMSNNLVFDANGFSNEVWEPFAAWVSQNHPDDVLVLYTDPNQTMQRIARDSIPLWKQRSSEYVEYVRASEHPNALEVDYVIDLNTGEMTPLHDSILASLGPERPVTMHTPVPGQYAASPDGSLLAYVGTGDDGSLEIFVAGIDGTGVRQLTGHPTDAVYPAWSPDGLLLAYQGSEGLFVLELATGQSTRVTGAPRGAWGPQFTPDSSSLLYTSPGNDDAELRIVPIDGGNSRVLIGREQGMGHAGGGSLSPDGSLVTMLGNRIGGPGAARFLAATDGSEPQYLGQLHSGNCRSNPAGTWSPDGSRIVCSGDSRNVLVVDVATGEVTSPAEGTAAVWLDDHTLLVET